MTFTFSKGLVSYSVYNNPNYNFEPTHMRCDTLEVDEGVTMEVFKEIAFKGINATNPKLVIHSFIPMMV
jgi:hypothetical protein